MRAFQRVRFLYFGGEAPRDASWSPAGQCYGCKKTYNAKLLTDFKIENQSAEQGYSTVTICARCMKDMGY